jgi:hypothetical protein
MEETLKGFLPQPEMTALKSSPQSKERGSES